VTAFTAFVKLKLLSSDGYQENDYLAAPGPVSLEAIRDNQPIPDPLDDLLNQILIGTPPAKNPSNMFRKLFSVRVIEPPPGHRTA
jgi:hypothetical protein